VNYLDEEVNTAGECLLTIYRDPFILSSVMCVKF